MDHLKKQNMKIYEKRTVKKILQKAYNEKNKD